MANKEKKIIDTLIISDIHLGSSLSRARELAEVFRIYQFKRLILNGDIFDGFNLKRLSGAQWGILSFIRKLSKKSEVIWIHGNHDGDAGALSSLIGVKVYRQYVWDENGKKYLAIHGHQFDRFLHKNIVISAIAIFIYNAIQKLSGQSQFISDWLKNNSKSWLRLSNEVAEGAVRYARLRKADYVFCGHTHMAEEREIKGAKYYNSGSWVEIPSSYIVIKDGRVNIKRVN
jgi:UDP-2,3-diacylglucosamine pyrophosphatase LpxH